MNAVIPVDGLKFTKGSKQELSVYKDPETSSGNPMDRVSRHGIAWHAGVM